LGLNKRANEAIVSNCRNLPDFEEFDRFRFGTLYFAFGISLRYTGNSMQSSSRFEGTIVKVLDKILEIQIHKGHEPGALKRRTVQLNCLYAINWTSLHLTKLIPFSRLQEKACSESE